MKTISNVKVINLVEHQLPGRAAIGWDFNGARFHIWVQTEPLELREPVLFKNPPLSMGFHKPGYFETRKLDVTKRNNNAMIMEAFRLVKEQGLIEKARAAFVEAEAIRRNEYTEALRRMKIKDAALELHAALELALFTMGSAGANCNTKHYLREAWATARKALAKARGK